MKIIYLDPGQANGRGHNYAMVHEFDEELVRQRRHRVHHVLHRLGSASALPRLQGQVHPVIHIDGYARLQDADIHDERRRDMLVRSVAMDLDKAPFSEADAVIMPTVYPLHLRALAENIALPKDCRVILGMLLPCEFWNPRAESAQALAKWMADSINSLATRSDLLVYSETGRYAFGHQFVSTPTLLPPLAGTTAQLVQQLAAREHEELKPRPTLGFFGSPFTSKGFDLLARTLERFGLACQSPAIDVRVCLPPGHAAMCERLNALGPWIKAESTDADNATYLRSMSEVDIVWAFYDPQAYCNKMSGIVPEAISLGKPVLLAEGCDALQSFLEANAPGSFLMASYEDDALIDVLCLNGAAWHQLRRCAAAHASLMQQMKSMQRYLAVCGVT